MDYVITVGSYRRLETLLTKTIPVLEKYNIPKDKINIFVGNEEEYKVYSDAIKDIKIIVGVVGLQAYRNFISNYYPVGTYIVNMDDDIAELYQLGPDGKLQPLKSLEDIIIQGFNKCVEHHYSLWGIAPTYNGFFMSDKIHTDLKFCIGHLYGYINRRIMITIPYYKDDYERSLENAVRDGGVIRFSGVSAKTKIGATGGISVKNSDRLQKNIKDCEFLMEKYPGLVRLNPKRPGEVLLARKIKKD